MKRIKLRFENIQQVVGSDELSVVLLTDESRAYAITVICDDAMTRQFLLRLHLPQTSKNMLPEALLQMLQGKYEMMIYGLHNGQYQVVLADEDFERNVRLRMSDAVLLALISDIPLYIEDTLFRHQAIPYQEGAKGIAIPINTMDVPRLNMALQQAIADENYELASQLRDEIKKRNRE